MSRRPVEDLSGPSAIQPVASPVSTYVRPAEPAPSRLHEVADGLAAFDQGLRGFMEKRREKQNEADAIRGEAAFNKANHVGWGEAVRQGLVPANASPIFQESYKKVQGNLAGIKLREKFNQAYVTWDGRNSDDPAAFDQFVKTFVAENIQTNDPHVLDGLNAHIRQLQADAYDVHGREVAASTYKGNVDTQAAIAGKSIDYASSNGLETGEGTDYEGLKGDLLTQREEVLATGVRKEDYDAQLVKAIAAKAIEHQDPQLLDLLDETLPGYEVPLKQLPEFRDIKQKTIEAIESDIRTRMNDNAKAQKKLDEEAEGKLVTTVFGVLDKDPTAEIPEDVIKQWEKYDPTARTKLARARSSLQDADSIESREDMLMVEQMIQDGATQKDIFDLVSNGVINDPATLKAALDRVEKRRKAMLEGSGVLKTQTSKRFLATIKERTTPSDLMGGFFAPDGLTDEGLEATKDFEMMLLQWEDQNPTATILDREKAINEIGDTILKRIIIDDRQYISPADAAEMERQQAEQEVQANGIGTDGPAAPGQPDEPQRGFWDLPTREEFNKEMRIDSGVARPREADTEARRSWELEQIDKHFTGEEPPSLEDMDPVFQDKIKADAKAFGMTPEEFTMDFWKKVIQTVGGAAGADGDTAPEDGGLVDKISHTIDSAVTEGQTITASAGADEEVRRASSLLDLLGQTEGTDRGRGYNETLGYGRYTNGDVDLVNMTLGDIDKLQSSMLKHPDNSFNSSALGRYQIVQRTMRNLKKQMGLTDDMKFTPELQDKMAMRLLKQRGLDKWLAGERSDESFMNNLAREWASLPTSNGNGYYSRKPTKASVAQVVSVFGRARNGEVGLPGQHFAGDGHNHGDGDLGSILTASDRGYDPDMDNVHEDVKTRLVALQQAFGKQLPVVSGYRDPERNAKSKGAKKSQHMHGNAIDISVKDMSKEERIRLIRLASETGFTGIGVYDNSLHFDIGKRRYWGPNYHGTSLPSWASAVIQEHMARTA